MLKEQLWRWMPEDLKFVRQISKHEWQQEIDGVRAALTLVAAGAPPTPGQNLNVGICMAKNEADIIESSVRHQIAQGLNLVLIVDHDSDDGTLNILVSLSKILPVMVFSLNLEGFYQRQTMTVLSGLARNMKADWILPFDADEFWFAEDMKVTDFLGLQASKKVYAEGMHAYPSEDPSASAVQSASLDLGTSNYHKVAFRPARMAYLLHGNHGVVRRGASSDGLRIAHVPVRSFEQLERKIRLGAASHRHAGSLAHGRHKHYLDSLSHDELVEYWSVVRQGLDWERQHLGWKPVGPFKNISIEAACDWQSLLRGRPGRC